MLTKDEYEDARRSTQDAHYTSTIVIDAIYAGLERFGFDGGRVLEPSIGSGNFVGRQPASFRDKTRITGIELDSVTARISALLYPETTVINKGFQEVFIPTNHFDAVVGNPPFGNQKVYDAGHRDLSEFSIHNYFIAKSVDKVREGGLVGVVVSNYFLDAQNPTAREHIANHARLVGAIRLPNNAFQRNALTSVTTDIVFFQKLTDGETTDRSWTTTGEIQDPTSGEPIRINQYFIDNPAMMLGTMEIASKMFKDQPALIARPGQDLASELTDAVDKLPQGIFERAHASLEVQAEKVKLALPDSLKVGAFFVMDDGRIGRRLPNILDDADYEIVEAKNDKAIERVKGMIEIRTALRDLMKAERSPDTTEQQLDGLRKDLNAAYDRFVKKNGYISSLVNKQAMHEDPDYPLLHSLERDYDRGISKEVAKKNGVEPREPKADKAAIFFKRVMAPSRDITRVESAKDALVVSMNETGRVDMPLMVRVSGKPEEVLTKELTGLIYLNPTKYRWETADRYLSGNVKEKLQLASVAANIDPRFADNVQALQHVQPADIEPVDIAIQFGSTWVPDYVVNDFVTHLIGNVHRNINYQASLGKWIAKVGRGDTTTMTTTWGTADAPANHLIECLLGNKPIQVKEIAGYDDYRNPIYVLNEEKTAAANQKANEISTAFQDWVWTDKTRRETLARIYNDRFNTNVAPKYDGSHLTLPGSSVAIELRPHQKNGIWRGLQEGNTLFDHRVGAGKTIVCIGTAMESRRMGLLKKPMFVVPNHLLLQWKDAFYELYPNANILVAEKTDFKKENREKLFARIATGDWDAVIVGHSSFKKIGMPRETLETILSEQIDDLTDAILEQKRQQGDRITIKEMEKARDRMKAKLEKAADTGAKDRVVTFDELGVDSVFVDEAQEFKNLYITTSLSRISGLGNLAGSDKAFDLFVKARFLQMKQEGRGYYSATGTPISNTIAECYTVQRYHMYDDMKRRGIVHFDAWASTFGQVVTGWELDATGVNYKLNSRFAKFQNVPELMAQYRTFADVITKEDLQRIAAEQGKRFPVPKVKGGKPRNIVVDRSEVQAKYMGVQENVIDETSGLPIIKSDGTPVKRWTPGSIIHRMENLPKDPRKDNPLKITNDARKAGLDYRLIDPAAEDADESKVNEVARQVNRVYKAWDERKGTQLVFCDLSTPKSANGKKAVSVEAGHEGNDQEDGDDEEAVVSMDDLLAGTSKFSVYDDLKQKLVGMDIPEHEIRFIHDADTDLKKAKLFGQMNRGEVRVLLGSTAKMGAGTNVQKRLVALHHIDAPWRPSDLEQREGRIERQGNMFYEEDPDNFEVEILRYATKQTYDSRMWQTIEYKAAGIEQFRRGDSLQRVIDDVAGEAANSAEMKAAATGNPLIFMQVKLSADLKKMEAVKANFDRNQHRLQSRIDWLEEANIRANVAIEAAHKAIAVRDANTTKVWQFVVGNHAYVNESKDNLLTLVLDNMKAAIDASHSSKKAKVEKTEPILVGKYRGFPVTVEGSESSVRFSLKINGQMVRPQNLVYRDSDKFGIAGFIQRLDNVLSTFEDEIQWANDARDREREELVKAKAELSKGFPHQVKLELLRKDVSDVLVELKKIQNNPDYQSDWVPLSESDSAHATKAALDKAKSSSGQSPHSHDLDGWPSPEFRDIAYEVERLAKLDIKAVGHVNAMVVSSMAAKWGMPEDEVQEVFNDWLKGNSRIVDKSIDLLGDPVKTQYSKDSYERAERVMDLYVKAQRDPLRGAEYLGARYHDEQFERGNGNEVHAILLERIAENREFAVAVSTQPGKRYASPEMVTAAEESTGLRKEAAQAAQAFGFGLLPTNRNDGRYTGKIIAVHSGFMLQDVGMKQAVVHHRDDLICTSAPKVGDMLQMSYRCGSAVVKAPGKDAGLSR